MLKLFSLFGKYIFLRSVRNASVIRLNVGAGGTKYIGWISAEKNQMDITNANAFQEIFKPESISSVLAEHVIEHIEKQAFIDFLVGIKPFININGSIRIAVPDAYHPSEYVRDLTKPGGLEPGADDHKEFYSIDSIRDIAKKTGYRLNPIEYFGADGKFNYVDDDWSNGYISRSYREYTGRFTSSEEEYARMIKSIPVHLRQQFIDMKMSYTSLIVDFIKLC